MISLKSCPICQAPMRNYPGIDIFACSRQGGDFLWKWTFPSFHITLDKSFIIMRAPNYGMEITRDNISIFDLDSGIDIANFSFEELNFDFKTLEFNFSDLLFKIDSFLIFK